MTKEPLVEVKDLSFSYEKTLVLENVNFTAASGEFIGIFGPNGGGKTTFLKLLMGFLKPSQGKVSLFGTTPKAARKKIGYVPQIARLDRQFPISVFDLVLMGCLSQVSIWGRYPESCKQKALEALEKVRLIDKKDKPFGTLSGGQAQRALIARALAGDPELLLLDEPTANVDPVAEQEILDILKELQGKMTLLMVTHDLQTILQKVGRLLCIHRHIHSFLPSEVCEHFGLGLYHSPLISEPFKAGRS